VLHGVGFDHVNGEPLVVVYELTVLCACAAVAISNSTSASSARITTP
jgi:hypothetical protein